MKERTLRANDSPFVMLGLDDRFGGAFLSVTGRSTNVTEGSLKIR